MNVSKFFNFKYPFVGGTGTKYLQLGLVLGSLSVFQAGAQTQSVTQNQTALVDVLKAKGVLTDADMAQIRAANSESEANQRLAKILLAKGVITQADYDRMAGDQRVTTNGPVTPAPTATLPANQTTGKQTSATTASTGAQSPPNTTEPGAPSVVEQASRATVNESLVPIRALPVGGIKRGGMVPAFKLGGVGVTPYGFIKLTGIEDSSSPNGDDFPLPGFLTDTGPDGAPEFHVKSRSTRFGTNFEWMDKNAKLTITGKLEADFEGNFNRSDNRNLSTIRSSNPSLRLAYGRLDYKFSDANTISALFGQDWTPFGSSTLPNILETTGLGTDFGTLYERSPQMRFGFTHKVGVFQIMPEVALVLPASGLPPGAANLAQQLGYGERQGPDSNTPEVEARIVAQFQLDHAVGVAPAQIIFSGEKTKSTSIVLKSAVPTAYQKTFSTGAKVDHVSDGWDVEGQLPTRFFTLIGKYYSGSDLRYFFAGQLYSFFNDVGGLTSVAAATSIDGAAVVDFGTNAAGQQVVAPQRPVRADGGFVQLGLPLSKIFNADPLGHNAGWSVYGTYGVDEVKNRDLNRLGAAGTRQQSTMLIGTLNYKLNKFVSFSFEESLYTTHANKSQPLPLFKGVPTSTWNDVREEFGPVFVF